MRLREILTEYKILKIETAFRPILVYQNPSNPEIIQLLSKHDMRGMIHNDIVYVWDANEGIHDNIAEQIGIDSYYVSFIISNTDDFSAFDMWEGRSNRGNGVYFMMNAPLKSIKSKMFMRMIGKIQ